MLNFDNVNKQTVLHVGHSGVGTTIQFYGWVLQRLNLWHVLKTGKLDC